LVPSNSISAHSPTPTTVFKYFSKYCSLLSVFIYYLNIQILMLVFVESKSNRGCNHRLTASSTNGRSAECGVLEMPSNGGRIVLVTTALSVLSRTLFVSRIVQKLGLLNRFSQNSMERWNIGHRRNC